MTPSPTNSAIAAAAKVQRYTLDPDTQLSYQPSLPFIREDADGEYVLHADYLVALAKLAEAEADRDMLRGLYRGAAADLASALTRAEQSEALLREAQNHLDEPAILGPNSLDGRISAHLAPKETT